MAASWTSRANAIFSYFGIVCAVLIAAQVATTYFLKPDIEPKLRFNSLKKLEQAQSFDGDYAVFTFDLDVDLTKAFHWGTKQLFVYVTAHYRTSTHADNQYHLRDYAHGLTKNEIKLVLSYQMHPIAGMIVDRHFDEEKFTSSFITHEYTN